MGKRRKGSRGGEGGEEYCQGFVDSNGFWNTGFKCPRWGGLDRTYCCGYDSNRYCCPPPDEGSTRRNEGRTEERNRNRGTGGGSKRGHVTVAPEAGDDVGASTGDAWKEYWPIMAGAAAGLFLLIIIITLICCCRQSQRRRRDKRSRGAASSSCPGCRHQTGGRRQESIVIANDQGDGRQSTTLAEFPTDGHDAEFCTMCRDEGQRWQIGVAPESMYANDAPPPYMDLQMREEKANNYAARKKDIHVHVSMSERTLRNFRSFMGTSMGSCSELSDSGTASPLMGHPVTSPRHGATSPRDRDVTNSHSRDVSGGSKKLPRDLRSNGSEASSYGSGVPGVPRMTIVKSEREDGKMAKYVMAPMAPLAPTLENMENTERLRRPMDLNTTMFESKKYEPLYDPSKYDPSKYDLKYDSKFDPGKYEVDPSKYDTSKFVDAVGQKSGPRRSLVMGSEGESPDVIPRC